ncbi:hypothetical protein FGD67_20105 [Colwellia sp. M166]|uniref:hypothetical protein n=1 Tax=Colwellia sp. M166 TaxID=2583805 RepID=UPI00211DFC0B|nr:hypothetical protein [Colwellia sp. M166]UUO25251.1 hypothetical protein FGD67_20105 [Colwellia sp. M166]
MYPKWLISQLEELEYETNYQLNGINEQYDEIVRLNVQQGHVFEQEAIAFRVSSEALNKLKVKQQNCLWQLKQMSQQIEQHCAHTDNKRSQANNLVNKASQVEDDWKIQYERATNWHENAISELKVAKDKLITAQSNEQHWQRELSSLQDTLATLHAHNNEQRNKEYPYLRDTSAVELRVVSAKRELAVAKNNYYEAKNHVTHARSNKSIANNQLGNTILALSDARKAIDEAQYCYELAVSAYNVAQVSGKLHEDLKQSMFDINEKIALLDVQADQQLTTKSQLKDFKLEAESYMKQVGDLASELDRDSYALKSVLQQKSELLVMFELPV